MEGGRKGGRKGGRGGRKGGRGGKEGGRGSSPPVPAALISVSQWSSSAPVAQTENPESESD